MATTLQQQVEDLARAARAASFETARLSRATKDRWILRAAERLETARERIVAANREDVREAEARGVDAALAKRLVLEGDKWTSMIAGLRDVAALPDPVGEISQMVVRPSGLRVGRMRIPLGVIAIVYESRPNVTVDAAALCVKAGNAVILRGGSEAIRSNVALGEELRAAAAETGENPPRASINCSGSAGRMLAGSARTTRTPFSACGLTPTKSTDWASSVTPR